MPVTEERLRVLNSNNDKAYLETRACIREALVTLLQQKPYGSITMTDITSGCSRRKRLSLARAPWAGHPRVARPRSAHMKLKQFLSRVNKILPFPVFHAIIQEVG